MKRDLSVLVYVGKSMSQCLILDYIYFSLNPGCTYKYNYKRENITYILLARGFHLSPAGMQTMLDQGIFSLIGVIHHSDILV